MITAPKPHTTPELLETPLVCFQCSEPITHRPYIKAEINVELPREGFGGYSALYSLRTFHSACGFLALGEPTSNIDSVRNLIANV